MRTAIYLGKAVTLLFWLSELVNLFQLIPTPLSSFLHFIAVAILAVHAVEVGLFTRLYARQLAEPKLHKMQILVFGIFHWLDLLRRGEIKVEAGSKVSRR